MKNDNKEYRFSEKWSPEIEQYNFTQIPNLLLACQGHLKLTDGELITLIHLSSFWFQHEGEVYPSITTLTKFSQKGYSTIQKRLRMLEQKEFVKRRHRFGTSNTYDLTPCASKLYRHQKFCLDLPRKQGIEKENTRSLAPSLTINKEYRRFKRQKGKESKSSVANILQQKYGGNSWSSP